MLVLKDLAGLHKTVQLKFLQHCWLGHRLDNCDTEWFALEMNRDHSVVFEIVSSSVPIMEAKEFCGASLTFHTKSARPSSKIFPVPMRNNKEVG